MSEEKKIKKTIEIDKSLPDTKQWLDKYLDLIKGFIKKLVGQVKWSKMGEAANKDIKLSINRNWYLVSLGVLVLVGMVVLFFIIKAAVTYYRLEQRVEYLRNTSSYELNLFKNSEFITEIPDTLEGLIENYDQTLKSKNELEEESNFRKSVYTYFLRNLLLPSLNIWKDPYSSDVDISLIGEKYLDGDPYQDIALLSQWSAIIRDSWKGAGINEVMDMKIGDIVELPEGYFYVPITISFKSDSKRAFLLLVDKVSTTSNSVNIGLINEFSYYLFNAIRDQKAEEVKELVSEYGSGIFDVSLYGSGISKDTNLDKILENMVIGRHLYSFIKNGGGEDILLDDSVIEEAIRESVVCWEDKTDEYCYFMFRNKYRNIPELAYSVGLESTINKTLALKDFFAELPSLISIQSFTFDKAKSQGLALVDNAEYVGNVAFNIYGKGISSEELNEISALLHEACFGTDTRFSMDADGAIARVDKALSDIGSVENKKDAIEKTANYLQLKEIFSQDAEDFWGLSQYNKAIKKFEYYRMLKDANLCSK